MSVYNGLVRMAVIRDIQWACSVVGTVRSGTAAHALFLYRGLGKRHRTTYHTVHTREENNSQYVCSHIKLTKWRMEGLFFLFCIFLYHPPGTTYPFHHGGLCRVKTSSCVGSLTCCVRCCVTGYVANIYWLLLDGPSAWFASDGIYVHDWILG